MAKAKNEYSVPVGDYGYDLEFTVYESDQETVYPLTGYTITLQTWEPGVPATLFIDGTCVITDASAGTCTYTIADGDCDTIGRYYGNLLLTKSGIVEHSQPVILLVREASG